MIDKFAFKSSFNVKGAIDNFKYTKKFFKDNPDYFVPDGLVIYVGGQGSGKTLSAVRYLYELKKLYPKAIIVSNINLTDYPFNNVDCFEFKNNDDLSRYNNGKKGVIFLIDEIQLYFNSLDSKNIDPQVMVQISQQRKQRKHIIGTSQVFGRMAKPLREQFSSVILCKSVFFNKIQWNQLLDRDSLDTEESTGTNISGKVIDRQFFFRSPKDFNRYDTYNLINNNFKNIKEADIYGN